MRNRRTGLIKQEKNTNCGTKAADVLAESTENVGAFATAKTSQRLSIRNIAQSATVWP